MKHLCRKLRSRRGFTFAELLMVLLILMLAGSVVVAGLPAAVTAYEKVVDGANAQLLLSTTVSSLRRELALASEVKTSGTALQSYTNGETGYVITLDCEGEKGISRQWSSYDESVNAVTNLDKPLVSEKAATEGMITSCGTISYENGVFSVPELTVKKNGTTLAKLDKPLMIRSVLNVKSTTT